MNERDTRKGRDFSLFVAEKIHASLVYNMAALEGNPFTFPEVKTLLEGVTVGGHKVSEQEQVLRISDGWKRLLSLVKTNQFELTKDVAVDLNERVAKNEALEVGGFRTGNVGIEGTDYKPPSPAVLDDVFAKLVSQTTNDNLPDSAYRFFLKSAAAQFFWDGNKRTGQLMMNGMLLKEGYLPVSIPSKRRLEYNEKMIRFYDTGKMKEMSSFLSECALEVAEPFLDADRDL